MKLITRNCNQDNFFRTRNFLREVFLLNDRLEHSWNVTRLDYWRWHFIGTCRVCKSLETGMAIGETTDGKIIAARGLGLANFVHNDPNPAWREQAGEFIERIDRRLLILMERNNIS